MLLRCARTSESEQDAIYTKIQKILSDPTILVETPKESKKVQIASNNPNSLVDEFYRILKHLRTPTFIDIVKRFLIILNMRKIISNEKNSV